MLTEIGSYPNPKLVFYGHRQRQALVGRKRPVSGYGYGNQLIETAARLVLGLGCIFSMYVSLT